jgi:hypothetical protein
MWVGNLVLMILSLPLLEENLRKVLTTSPDGPSVFVTRFINPAHAGSHRPATASRGDTIRAPPT